MNSFHPPLRPTPPTSHPAVAPRTITPLDVRAVSATTALAYPLTADDTTAHVRVALHRWLPLPARTKTAHPGL